MATSLYYDRDPLENRHSNSKLSNFTERQIHGHVDTPGTYRSYMYLSQTSNKRYKNLVPPFIAKSSVLRKSNTYIPAYT